MSASKRTIVITGGSKGIGRAICLRFAREGARIIFAHYDPDDRAEKKTLELLDKMNIVGMGVITLKDGCVETLLNWNDLNDVAILGIED